LIFKGHIQWTVVSEV